jgi:branched-chain amino acid aminotransferase
MHPNVLYNDQIHPADQKILAPGQLGLLSGWGVFTTLRIYDGIPFAYERHWQRMVRDAKLMHLDLPYEAGEVRANLMRLIEANEAQESSMRVCVFRSQGGYWAGPGSGNKSDLIALTNDLQGWDPSVALDVAAQCRHAATPFAGTKTLSWAWNLALAEKANQDGFAEVILLNERDEVAECTSANIFAAKGGVTYTPPLSSGPLPGVTREVMLGELNLPVEEKVLRIDDLYQADEVFITSSTRELMPVTRIQDRPIAPGVDGPWPVMEKLQQALSVYIRRYIDDARRRAA